MRLLKSTVHADLSHLTAAELTAKSFHRQAARGIILKGEEILMLYTERYHDYSIPGGGVDEGEDIQSGLIRELEEETGAQHIEIISEFGRYEEFRPWNREGFEVVHMDSFCFVCDIHAELGETKLEAHEIQNGMTPVWINIHQAIAHNEHTIANSPKKGMSIERETFLLKQIVAELL
ncbi:NUDIX domain-containing protein [Shewanella sp. 1CM18E]|uniref:NUDIX hydrolase n=1 Tax=Shewanella sp. 1CM18E TaxID=2929169 RepID=UPI0020BF3119|nr:NUDIX hydrolase [Shewanella sp. 1CM18E]MCK8047035.1 NUDIX domain-containing protein [Shewanella sp. 1CM18E]